MREMLPRFPPHPSLFLSTPHLALERKWTCPWLSGSRILLQGRRHQFDPWVRKILWRRKWQPTPIFLPGESHGWRSLVGYRPWGRKHNRTHITAACPPPPLLSAALHVDLQAIRHLTPPHPPSCRVSLSPLASSQDINMPKLLRFKVTNCVSFQRAAQQSGWLETTEKSPLSFLEVRV